ncbi:UDP-galactopyranose/dTDP-fucopyranose mutase family protein [Acidocella aminolytica]|jgi:UDP-galactopyranose mutase|uniref:UDP-galactopyranose mutase n=1 Tax=Acidocella aminolytica 101 = DSM 11237 TaxID=1120923 RepID=A0A0D6PC70_9PROT|nr:UDP-galactopyranose mutase [Acidocella aminolytica]GAN78798.1 UDP-galactopyranose mutase [Acidocella aminolytica 101 = DSM 11237]GBQ32934.1 UDP-galactopyranose mutase [Acidocella aminolytica 101 = DSM 11237]SHE50477.1 UDP-galactopyranose mutase [Acidocella aminolytica 101 = DSM 11237]
MEKIGIVGAGFSGSVIARELAERGYQVDIFDTRPHVAGNCHTDRDAKSGVMLHVYGPHIFHTSNERVWDYVRRFDRFMPFINRVKAHARGKVFSLPINLMTINQLFGKQFSPEQARSFLAEQADQRIVEPRSFEEQALRFVGREIYETFFRGYTRKQWGMEPSDLPASILKRLPVRFNYDDNYYASKFQGIPEHGYSYIVERILDHANIELHLSTSFTRAQAKDYAHVFYSGPIDAWFGFSEGRLGYRTLDFEVLRGDGDYQGNPVINYCDENVPWTRVAEHKHFTPWEEHEKTVLYREHSRLCGEADTPYYPIRLVNDKARLERYVTMAITEPHVTFVGRLGTYRYLDMHITIGEALEAAERFVNARELDEAVPAFCVDPLA